MLRGDWGTVDSEGRLGTFVPVSNPVTQRLTVFSEDASVSKKNPVFFSAEAGILSITGAKTGFNENKKADLFEIRFYKKE